MPSPGTAAKPRWRKRSGRSASRPPKQSARLAAAHALSRVIADGQSLTAVLPDAQAALPAEERALLAELCYGCLRWLPELMFLSGQLLRKPLKPGEHQVQALILTGLYQLRHLRTPPYAAVAATVAAAHELNKPWAPGLINAVLRGYQRREQDLTADLGDDVAAATAHPIWLIEALQQAWPDSWQAIVAANNSRPPQTLRVNQLQIGRADYLQQLAAADIVAAPALAAPAAITLESPVDVSRLPGFADGRVSIQDSAAQLAAPLLTAAPGQRVLDACAAPGGKSAHWLELAPALSLTALDHDAERLRRVEANLDRLGLRASVVHGDACNPADWWDGAAFDRILLDPPCSGTGVIRRHPDIKLLRRAADVDAFAGRQLDMLLALWPLLKPGGQLLYATCSVLPLENVDVVSRFLTERPEINATALHCDWGRTQTIGRQTLPVVGGMDGFYFALLTKTDG